MLRSPLQVPCGTHCQRTSRITEFVWHAQSCLAHTRECITYFIRGDASLAPSGDVYYNVNNLLAYNAHYVKWGLL
jgi:hypothetical protein